MVKINKKTEIVIAVIPFEILADSSSLDYLVTGFVDDLTIDLSRFNSLHVISPSSTKKIEKENQDVLLKKLNADYIIKGSFRLINENVRISTQLITADDESIVWAERFDEKLDEIFEIHDEIIQKIVTTLEEQIQTNILSVSKQKETANLEAYECLLQGFECLREGTFEGDSKAREFFDQALKIEPNYARAYSGISLSYFNEWSCQAWERWGESQEGAFKYAKKAMLLDDKDTTSLTVIGRIYLYKGDYDKAEHYLRKSLRLNPNDASNISQIAVSFVYLGYTKEAEKLYKRAMKLNPLNEESYYPTGSLINFELGDYNKCIELGLKTNFDRIWVDMPAMLAAAYFHLSNYQEMKKYWEIYETNFQARILHGKTAKKNEGLQWIIDVNPYKVKSNYIPFFKHLDDQALKNLTPGIQNIEHENVFRKGSGLWEMSFEGKSIFLPDIKGYHDIRTLIENCNKDIHCTELMGKPIRFQNEEFAFDSKSKQEYRKKIEQLTLDIDEAEIMNDFYKANKLKEEYEKLVEHLSKSLGLGGKTRKLNSSVEKARSAITWRLRNAIKKISAENPSLGKHLSNSIKTGIFCSYSPEKEFSWQI